MEEEMTPLEYNAIKDQEYENDLRPNPDAGINRGKDSYRTAIAYEVKEIHNLLPDFTDDLLKRLTVVVPGSRLEQGAVYVDLTDPNREVFKTTGNMEAERGHWYAPKSDNDYELWNRIIGVDNPDRLNQSA